MIGNKVERADWADFPKVISNGDLGGLSKEPGYQEAKQGNVEAALDLVQKLLTDEVVDQLRDLISDQKPIILPVIAEESTGRNKIPLAYAQVLADKLNLKVDSQIVQKELVGRTGQGADHRLVFNPTFSGAVEPGQNYIIVDDTLTMGGTLASLRGYVENHGGKVLGASVMTAHPGALDIAVKPKMIKSIINKHGNEINEYWTKEFGYGIEKLTQGEAGHIRAAKSIDEIRDRISAARNEGSQHLARAGNTETQKENINAVLAGKRLLGSAQMLEREQTALLDSDVVEKLYLAQLENHVQAKYTQVERIEDKLELLIEQEQSRLQQTKLNRPGFFSKPGSKGIWEQKQMQQQTRLQVLMHRLEEVREISDRTSLKGSKINSLAENKLRKTQPDLAKVYDEVREKQRLFIVKQRKKEAEKNKKLKKQRVRSQSLSITR